MSGYLLRLEPGVYQTADGRLVSESHRAGPNGGRRRVWQLATWDGQRWHVDDDLVRPTHTLHEMRRQLARMAL